jgi:hypothetical protein
VDLIDNLSVSGLFLRDRTAGTTTLINNISHEPAPLEPTINSVGPGIVVERSTYMSTPTQFWMGLAACGFSPTPGSSSPIRATRWRT